MRKMTLFALVLGGSLIACDGQSSDGDKGTAPQAPPNAQPEDAGETLASVNGADIGSKAFEQAAARKVSMWQWQPVGAHGSAWQRIRPMYP